MGQWGGWGREQTHMGSESEEMLSSVWPVLGGGWGSNSRWDHGKQGQITKGPRPLLKEIGLGFVFMNFPTFCTCTCYPRCLGGHTPGQHTNKCRMSWINWNIWSTLAKPQVLFQPLSRSFLHASSLVLPKQVVGTSIITSTTLFLSSVSLSP